MTSRSSRVPDVEREFASWHEFATEAADLSRRQWTKGYYASQKWGEASWYGTSSFAEAVDMALRTGWPEGRNMLSDFVTLVSPRPDTYKNLEFDVAGAFPCVPLYCAGDPGCMILDPVGSLRSSRPIIRIDYNNWISAYVKIQDMMLRGAAVLSLANSLEERGYSTELRIVGNSSSFAYAFRYSIVYKKAGDLLDIDSAAFALAHPASMRRLAFAIMEQHRELEPTMSSGYGQPMHEPNAPTSGQPNGAIFVPGSKGGETRDSAILAVQLAAKDLLTQISESEND